MRLIHLQSCHLCVQNKSHCCSCFHPSCHLCPCCYLLPGLLHQLPYWSPSSCPLIYLLYNCLSEVFIFLQIFKSGHAHFSLEPSSGFQLHLESPVCSSPWPTRPLTTWLCFLHLIWFQPLGVQPLQLAKLIPALANPWFWWHVLPPRVPLVESLLCFMTQLQCHFLSVNCLSSVSFPECEPPYLKPDLPCYFEIQFPTYFLLAS